MFHSASFRMGSYGVGGAVGVMKASSTIHGSKGSDGIPAWALLKSAYLKGLWPMPPPSDFSKFSKKSHFSKNWSKSVFKPCLGRFGLEIRIQREKPVLFMGSNHYFIIF